ncbi:MAG: 4-hydroxythreonine-4-phosphate dehydrogenase [Thermogutta sp.]|nr:MAG: 4-hydroxythreonine-4-phosphate dehydrogenase [Thermogutta sp.]
MWEDCQARLCGIVEPGKGIMSPIDERPIIAITTGDPAGIGPEIVAAAWSNPTVHEICRPVVVGYSEFLRRAAALRRLQLQITCCDEPARAQASPETLVCIPPGDDHAPSVQMGRIDPKAGQAAYEAILLGTELALAEKVDALVTAPINKEALHAAGHHYPGHTELLAELCGVSQVGMVLYLGPGAPLRGPAGLAIVHVTLHMAMKEIFRHLTAEAILNKIRLIYDLTRCLKNGPPRIGVCALNPHAGENGLFGNEENLLITPAVRRAQDEGLPVEGPVAADALMVQARDGRFDGVVAMYHDQGHITLKLLGMHRAVNITAGLPIIRTSVAHGTAFDIAGQGKADPGSLIEAIRVAALLARHRRRNKLSTGAP